MFYDPVSKRESTESRRPDEPRPRKTYIVQSTKNVMVTIFWDSEDILLIDFKESNTTVNGTYYASLSYKLRDSIRAKRGGKLTKDVQLLHHNAHVHIAAISQVAFKN